MLLALRDHSLRELDAAIVSSVLPQLGHEYEQLSERYFGGALLVVGPGYLWLWRGAHARLLRPRSNHALDETAPCPSRHLE